MVLSRGTFALFYKTKTSSHEKANWLMPLGDKGDKTNVLSPFYFALRLALL
jgi:hypothetical protein